MCGICGFTQKELTVEESRRILEKMCRLLDYRGPDDEGVFVDEHIALGHRRLSIIDLSPGGHQPMGTEDGQVWITFNGEIYNFIELKKELASRGARFRTSSDTEVILKAYEVFGEDCVKHLNGMFAFALWDAGEKKLLLARDRLGKKPLYYYYHNDQFIFASEMKAILVMPGVAREIDFEALNLYLTSGYIPAPWSVLKGIRKVPEANYLIFKNGSITKKRYWDLPDGEPPQKSTESQYAEELESLLEDAVRCRMISDVPLGAFLSGGIDSSAVVAMMAKINSRPVKTFTIDFEEESFSELKDAQCVANHCRTHHEVLRVSIDALSLVPELVWHFDEPFADSSAIPTYYVSKMAREHVAVILSGDGGDELFAGYKNYLKKDEYQHILRLPKRFRRVLFGKIAQALPIQAPMRNFLKFVAEASPEDGPEALGFCPYIKDDVLTADFNKLLSKYDSSKPRLEILSKLRTIDKLTRLQFVDTKLYLPGDILVKVDRMSMARLLETRAPLLDYRLVEFAARLPVHLKMRGQATKYFLKKVLEKHLPSEILTKRKQGFAVPINHWLRTTLNGFTKDILLDRRCRERGIINPKVMQKVLEYNTQGRRDYSEWIWLLLNLELWFQTFLDSSTRRI